MPCENSHNRGARGDSSFMLDAMASSSEKPPLQMRSIKWWEYVTTAYKFAKPFVIHIVVTFLVIIAVETSHHLPGFSAVNAFGFDHMGLQLALLFAGGAAYVVLTVTGMKGACRNFEKLDL